LEVDLILYKIKEAEDDLKYYCNPKRRGAYVGKINKLVIKIRNLKNKLNQENQKR